MARKLSAQGKKAYKLVERLLYARRDGNIKREQTAYDALRQWCEETGFDMAETIESMRAWMLQNKIAPSMNGVTCGEN